MALDTIQLGGTTKENIKKINDNFSNILAKDNTTSYVPSADYHPAECCKNTGGMLTGESEHQ